MKVTRSKLIDRIRTQNTLKRGGGAVRGELAFLTNPDQSSQLGIDGIAGIGLPPEVLAALEDEHQRLMALLADDWLRNIASFRMQGYTVPEIAREIGQTERTVKRKLERIRRTWQSAMETI